MQITYLQNGDYIIPNIISNPTPLPFGKFASLRKAYLQNHKKGLYAGLLLSGELNTHLQNIQEQAQSCMNTIMEQISRSLVAPDKATDQMGWIRYMEHNLAITNEIVLSELIYD